ncbi:MAG: hypothetical protein IPJ84_10170 [Bdellovibrionales bacterium]|nr:hypothetical protein [Bdellovibrionales bacterium]
MKTFLALYTCAEDSQNHEAWKQLAPEVQKERMQAGMAAREQWLEKYKEQIVSQGSSLGEKTKFVDSHGVRDLPRQMGAFIVVRAQSHDEAAKMFLAHPHFAIFPGDGVQIIECLD